MMIKLTATTSKAGMMMKVMAVTRAVVWLESQGCARACILSDGRDKSSRLAGVTGLCPCLHTE